MSSVPEMNLTPLTPRVLIVDDERYVREIVRRWLERIGYECTCAESVGAACEILQQQKFDIVTSDISMPGQSGMELLRTIKEKYPETAVLMLTANADTRLAIQALTLGAYGYLLKPVEQEELLCQIERALEHRRLVVENREYTNLLEWKVREQTRHIRLAHEETIQRLVTACMFRDDETGGHIKRTGLSSALVAQAAGWSTEMVELIQLAAPMHDVGKVGIPDSILRKPGKLTTEEFKVMQQHTVIGADMLSGSLSPVLQMAEQIAHFHHERWDGTGYPNRLAGEDIPKAARILAIIDVYDALTHDRVYRRALPEEQVLQIIEDGRGTHFDPSVTKAFFEALPGIRTVNVYELDHEFSATSEAAVPPAPWISNVTTLAGAH
ncbi:MAG: response regulator containing a CheY-like receiver domain and an domain [Planctomycetaceae bacterium]|nr:response regulator containing a CheY-like receiver domain and an domain [Planctomycetaceae bacterium]